MPKPTSPAAFVRPETQRFGRIWGSTPPNGPALGSSGASGQYQATLIPSSGAPFSSTMRITSVAAEFTFSRRVEIS